MGKNETFKDRVSNIFKTGTPIESSDYTELSDAITELVDASAAPTSGGAVKITSRARKGSIYNPVKPEWINMSLDVIDKGNNQFEIAYNSAPFYGSYTRGIETYISIGSVLSGNRQISRRVDPLQWEMYREDTPNTAVMRANNGVARFFTLSWGPLDLHRIDDSGASTKVRPSELVDLPTGALKYFSQLSNYRDNQGTIFRQFEWTCSNSNAVCKYIFNTIVTGSATFVDTYNADTGNGFKYLHGEDLQIISVSVIKNDLLSGKTTLYKTTIGG